MFEQLANLIVFNILNLTPDEKLTTSLHFFIYDFVKISVLVFAAVSIISFIRTFLSKPLENFFTHSRTGIGNLLASIFGAITPFCSCSSIPLFMGFLKARIPVGIAFSFIITSPLVNEVAIVILADLFGLKIAGLYLIAGISLGVVGGIVFQLLGAEKMLTLNKVFVQVPKEVKMPKTIFGRIKYSIQDGGQTLRKIIIFIAIGVGIGSFIHGYVPQDFFIESVGNLKAWGPVVAVLLGVPIYAGCSTAAPMVFSIAQTGVPLGTSLAFMMAIAGLSLPEAVMLKKVMSMKLLAMFFGIVTIGIILIGYLFNFVVHFD